MSKEEAAEDREKKNKQETSKKYSLLTFSATNVQRTRGNAHHRRISNVRQRTIRLPRKINTPHSLTQSSTVIKPF